AVNAGGGNDGVNAGNGDNTIHGGPGDDTITVGTGNNHIYGEDGNDTIDHGTGNNTIDGGSGDNLYYTNGEFQGEVTVVLDDMRILDTGYHNAYDDRGVTVTLTGPDGLYEAEHRRLIPDFANVVTFASFP